MVKLCAYHIFTVPFFLVCFIAPQPGVCVVEQSIPESGSTVAGGEGESVFFYCRVLNEVNGTQAATEWFIERIGAGSSGPQTIVGDSNFNIVGETLPNSGINSQTNLTIQSLTSDLDRANLSCGLGGTPITIGADFTLRIYRPPDLNDEFERTVIENSTVEIDVSGSGEEPFPFPQQFQWMKDGVNVTNSSRISYGYPIVVFENVLREDIGNYTLTAANFRLDNESLQVGNDTGSFFLDVFLAPSEPRNVSVDSIGVTWAILSWERPEFLGSPPATMYRIFATASLDPSVSTVQTVNESMVQMENDTLTDNVTELLTANVTELLPGTEYSFVVTAISSVQSLELVTTEGPQSVAVFGTTNVTVAPNYTSPGPQTVTEDDTNVQLNVSVNANPFPLFFNWSRNGALITSSDDVALTADSITFTRVQRGDAGTYTVFSSNTAGSDSTSFELTVQFPPAVGIGAGNLRCNNDVSICAIMTGANGYLECTTVGVPTPNLTLTTAAPQSENVMLSGNQVMITTAVAGNAGTYTCNASNFLNFDEQTFQLQVGGAPDVNDLIINVTSDTQVLITWMFSNSGVPVDPFEVTTTCPNFQPPASRVDVPRMGYEVTFTQDIPPTIPGGTECRVIVRVTNLLGSDTVENMFIVSGATMMTTSGGAAFSAAISVLLLILTSLVL